MSSDSWLATPWVGGLPVSKASIEVEPLGLSVTDENGGLTDVNDVFIAWTRFARERLIGSAHSIVRHPGMPGGLFKLLWDRLKVGKPACAYLQNLPADGNTYAALVTISPTLGGYIAVEQKPCRPEAAEALQKLYSSVRSAEFQARDDGVSATVAVQRGAELLVDLLRQLGFSSYDDFMWTALPQEVDEYCRRVPGPIDHGADDGSPAAAVLAASGDLARELFPWSLQQTELLRTWGSLSRTLVSLKPMMAEARRAADSISEDVEQESSFNAMRLSLTVWASMIAEIEKVITDLPNDLLALRQACAQTRFWIGLAQIHTEMIGQLAEDFTDPVVLERSRGAVGQLCTTLDRDFDDLSWRMEKNARFAATVAERIQSLHDLLAMPRDLIDNWKLMSTGRNDAFVTRLLPEIERQLTLADETLTMLQTLADQCLAIAVVQPMDTAHQCVRRIQRSVAYAPEQEPLRVTPQSAAPAPEGHGPGGPRPESWGETSQRFARQPGGAETSPQAFRSLAEGAERGVRRPAPETDRGVRQPLTETGRLPRQPLTENDRLPRQPSPEAERLLQRPFPETDRLLRPPAVDPTERFPRPPGLDGPLPRQPVLDATQRMPRLPTLDAAPRGQRQPAPEPLAPSPGYPRVVETTSPRIPDVYSQLGSDDAQWPYPTPPSVYSQLPQTP